MGDTDRTVVVHPDHEQYGEAVADALRGVGLTVTLTTNRYAPRGRVFVVDVDEIERITATVVSSPFAAPDPDGKGRVDG